MLLCVVDGSGDDDCGGASEKGDVTAVTACVHVGSGIVTVGISTTCIGTVMVLVSAVALSVRNKKNRLLVCMT